MRLRGPENSAQNLPGQERKVHAQDQTFLEAGVAETSQDPAQGSRLADLIGINRNMQEGEYFRRTYDENIVYEWGQEVDGAIHEALPSQG
jgi:hypothetical protein